MYCPTLKGPPYAYANEVDWTDGRTAYIMAEIARSHDVNRIVSVVSELAEIEFADEAHWDFSFGVDVATLDGSQESFTTQDRLIAAGYIPTDIKPRVMDVVCESLGLLVEIVRPGLIYMVAKENSKNEKAYVRHHKCLSSLQNLGFLAGPDGTDRFGRRFWTMRR